MFQFTTKTGIGYFEDDDGRVIDYYNFPSGKHSAGDPRVKAVDVDTEGNLPPIDEKYKE